MNRNWLGEFRFLQSLNYLMPKLNLKFIPLTFLFLIVELCFHLLIIKILYLRNTKLADLERTNFAKIVTFKNYNISSFFLLLLVIFFPVVTVVDLRIHVSIFFILLRFFVILIPFLLDTFLYWVLFLHIGFLVLFFFVFINETLIIFNNLVFFHNIILFAIRLLLNIFTKFLFVSYLFSHLILNVDENLQKLINHRSLISMVCLLVQKSRTFIKPSFLQMKWIRLNNDGLKVFWVLGYI